jgi:hypothetical protein
MGNTTMTFIQIITSQLVPTSERMNVVDKAFGIQYVLVLEPAVFRFAETLAHAYKGAYWNFHTISNGGFYMAPRSDTIFAVSCENGFEGKLSADALGIASCLYAYSHLSFGDDAFAETCANQFHMLREYMFQHPEVKAILRTID